MIERRKKWVDDETGSGGEQAASLQGGTPDTESLGWRAAWTKVQLVARALKLAWDAASAWTIMWAVALFFRGLLPVATVYITKLLVDAISGAMSGGLGWDNLGPVAGPAGAMAAVLVANQFFQHAINWVRSVQAELVTDHIKRLIHEKTSRIDLELYDIPEYYDHMSRANDEADHRVLSILENSGSIAQNVITLVGIAGILIPYGWWVPFMLVVSTGPALAVVLYHQRKYHAWWKETTEQRRWARYFDLLVTKRKFAQEVRLFDLGQKFTEAYQAVRAALRNSHIKLLRDQRLASFGAGLLALATTGGIMAWMVLRAFRGAATLGDIALFYQAFNQGQGLMRTLLKGVGTLYADALFLEHLFAFLSIERRVKTAQRPLPVPQAVNQAIRVQDVTFAYPGSEHVALREFDLVIPGGRTVAVVGKNGAGKSTLIKLLCRFYDPTEGTVTWDGTDLRRFPPSELWKRITVHFQNPVNYAGTLAESISFGDYHSDFDGERIRRAARQAGADEVAAQLPQGFDTMLGKQFKGGEDLSGGQWQRVALARAFYRDAPFILLDEPTSFMDSWAEMKWLDRFCDLAQDRTAVIVTHRFTTAMRADLIFVMDEGCVVESGTHQELLEEDGVYAASWRKQVSAAGQPASTV